MPSEKAWILMELICHLTFGVVSASSYNAEVKLNLGMHYIPKTMGHLGYNLEFPPLFEQYVE